MRSPYYLMTLILSILLLVFLFWMIIARKRLGRKPSYRAFFIIGICWVPVGIASENFVFAVLGGVFLILGLANFNQWKHERRWSDLNPMEKRIKIIAGSILGLILLAGIIVYLLLK